jgi:hypothetical protein
MSTDETIETKSTEELLYYILHWSSFSNEAVEGALNELLKRQHPVAAEKEMEIRQELQRRSSVENNAPPLRGRWGRNVVKYQDAPLFHSQQTILICSVLFSVFFGSILLCINLSKYKLIRPIIEVIVFAVLYTTLQLSVLSKMQQNSLLTLIFSYIGGHLLNYFFWNRYIGAETKYRARAMWKPILIGFIMLIPFVYLAFNGTK